MFKEGDKTEFSNYRPITLLTSFSKIIEKIIYKRLYRYLNDREKSSTDMATYALLNTVLSSLDKKHVFGGIFWDLQKAFDCVNRNILLTKLEFYGISAIANQLMRSYLNHRYQRIVIKDNRTIKLTSEWEPVKHGVPQGSILGLLVFLVYINNLSRTINGVADSI